MAEYLGSGVVVAKSLTENVGNRVDIILFGSKFCKRGWCYNKFGDTSEQELY